MYKCLAMLASIVNTVYIDNAWVPAEYPRTQEMQGQSLEEKNTVEAVTCWNLQRILDAKQHGQPMPEELTMDDLVREDMMCSK